MSAPDVSFVVNAYCTERYIAECLESVLAVTGDWSFEVIVIDDCSADRTAEVAEDIARRDNRVRVIRNEKNVNAAESVNRAFAQASGRFIARVDSDDRLRPDFLLRTIPVMEAHASVGLTYGDVAIIDEHGCPGELQPMRERRQGRPAIGRELIPLMRENYIPAPATIARREAWQGVLPIPAGRNFLDWYCTLNMARRWDFAFVDAVLADYRLHPANMHKAMVREKYGESITWLNLDEVIKAEKLSRAVRSSVLGANYVTLAHKYFGYSMRLDALRCYAGALWHEPSRFLKEPSLIRLALACLFPRSVYDAMKRILKRSKTL